MKLHVASYLSLYIVALGFKSFLIKFGKILFRNAQLHETDMSAVCAHSGNIFKDMKI